MIVLNGNTKIDSSVVMTGSSSAGIHISAYPALYHYDLNEGSGTLAYTDDNTKPQVLTGTWIDGLVGKSVKGTLLGVTVDKINLGSTYTINTWVKADEFSANGPSYKFWEGTGVQRAKVEMFYDTGNITVPARHIIRYSAYDGGEWRGNEIYNYDFDEQWLMVTCTYTNRGGNDTLDTRLYVNGIFSDNWVNKRTYSTQLQDWVNQPITSTGDIQFGDSTIQSDEISCWNRELSQTEITELYNGGLPLVYPWWII